MTLYLLVVCCHLSQANDEKLGVQRLLKMAKGVATGMDYLSTIGFVHRVSGFVTHNIILSTCTMGPHF